MIAEAPVRADVALPAPFYDRDGITLYCGDSLALLPLLGEVDACVTDPPYQETNLKWDVWPKGWPRLVRPLTRQLWCFGSFRMFWEEKDDFADWKFAQDLVWEKHNGSNILNDRFRRVHELPVHFYRGEWESLHKQVPIQPNVGDRKAGHIVRRGGKPAHFGGIEHGAGYERGRDRMMRSVINVPSCHGYAVNETQKPEGIVAPLLEYSVPVGGVVLDPFSGSGTTLVVARAQGKRAIGIERREEQCEHAVARLNQSILSLS